MAWCDKAVGNENTSPNAKEECGHECAKKVYGSL